MITLLVLVAVGALVISLLLSPIETLGWWAGWYGQGLTHPVAGNEERSGKPTEGGAAPPSADHYLLYLDGIANVGGEQYENVQALLDAVAEQLPSTVVVADIMPYSVRNLSLIAEDRLLSRWWRRMYAGKTAEGGSAISFSINLRNLFQVLVAADQRYGRIFGRGEAQVMLEALAAKGYELGSGTPITILGYSGGVQVGLAAAPFLRRALGAPLGMISLGGVMASEDGLNWLDIMYHLQGSIDRVPLWGQLLFPGRWPVMVRSHWNRMLRSDRLRFVNMGPMKHHGPGNYLDDKVITHGESNLARTTRVIVGLIHEALEVYAGTPVHSTPSGESGERVS